jgi:hypothetical protein
MGARPGGEGTQPPARDLPGRILAAAAARMPASRRVWGQALAAELDYVQGRGARWRFALAAVRVTLARSRPAGRARRAGPAIRALTACGAAACVALTLYAVRRYPQPAGSHAHRYELLCPLLAVLLACYTGLVRTIS